MQLLNKKSSYAQEVSALFKSLLEEYCSPDTDIAETIDQINNPDSEADQEFDIKEEEKTAESFLKTPCPCLRNCQKQLNKADVISNRAFFRALDKRERNNLLLAQLKTFLSHSEYSESARSRKKRERKKFDYHISIDRPVCKAVFLFYFGETPKRLDRLKDYVSGHNMVTPVHGNSGRTPTNAHPISDREKVTSFILNFIDIHGLPDPGRDVRKGKGRLRILLPSIMSYQSVHQQYAASIKVTGGPQIPYRTFLKIWQDEFPYVKFNDPRSDLCMTCEDFKKRLNQAAAALDENKEQIQAQIHQNALDHLKHVKQERLFYKANIKIANEHYHKIRPQTDTSKPHKPNSKNILSHYSWDFAQQLQYPFEDQQVGPIYFKTPRKAQLFGVCNEGIPRQYNYLIDEEHFPEKNANTVISLLDHFFANYGLGEKWVHLSADNCVGQNKNNALLQYLMFRVLTGLHDKIELSFLVVGHTKFSPDGYFGLIKRHYRKSQVYTYAQLANIVESSSRNGHNFCARTFANKAPPIIYRDWSSWLAQYFSVFKGITSYHHFKIDKKNPSILLAKERIDSEEIEINLTTKHFPFSKTNPPKKLPNKLLPPGLSLKRQWYLYDEIRCHIPSQNDKNQTCPKPNAPRSKIKD